MTATRKKDLRMVDKCFWRQSGKSPEEKQISDESFLVII